MINERLINPRLKPNAEHITDVIKNFIINDIEVLDVNLEAVPTGQIQDRKVIIGGNLFLGVEYTAAIRSQEEHFAHYNIRICVEHEQHHVVNPRELSEVLVVLIWLEPKA